MCLVEFQKIFRKIFFGVWLCSWKYYRKHIFYLLLTFSHIFSVAKRIYNIIHFSIQKHKQNPEKNHQIQTLRAITIGGKARSRLARCFAQSRSRLHKSLITIARRQTISADDLGDRSFGRSRQALLSFSFSRSLSLFCAWPGNGLKVKWKCKTIFGSKE